MRTENDLSKAFRRYLAVLLFGLVAGFALTAVINITIDPYGLWRLVEIPGINSAKSHRRDQNYMFKAVDLMRQKPRVLLFGSSRAAFGLDPRHSAFDRLELAPVYNAALTGGHLYALRRYLEHAVYNNEGLELVIWGLDFFAFNENVRVAESFDEQRLVRSSLHYSDLASSVFSLDALKSSVNTVRSNISDPGFQAYSPLGQLTATDMARQVAQTGMIDRFDQSVRLYLNGKTRMASYQDSSDAWGELDRILVLADEHDIKLRFFVSPVHTALLEVIHQRGLWLTYAEWLSRLSERISFWDFALPSTITIEPIAEQMQNYWDVSHYRSNVGDIVLSRMLLPGTESNQDFGKLVDRSNIDQHIEDLSRRFMVWRDASPDAVLFVSSRKW